MPYTGTRRIEEARRTYREHQARHHEKHPDYVNGWPRPCPETAADTWQTLIEAGARLRLGDLLPDYDRPAPEPGVAQQALCVALDAAIQAGEDGRMLTDNLVFDVLARRWSDHYRKAREDGPARISYEMSAEVLKASWHDLRLNDVRVETLLPLVHHGCGLYVAKRSAGSGYTVELTEETAALREAFIKTLNRDKVRGGRYRRHGSHPRLLLAEETPDDADEVIDVVDTDDGDNTETTAAYKVVAGWAYNVAEVGDKSRRTIQRLQATQLYLNQEEFLEECKRLEDRRGEIDVKLWDEYRVDVTKSTVEPRVAWTVIDAGTGEPRPGRLHSARERAVKKAKWKCRKDAEAVKAIDALVAEYDKVNGQFLQMRGVRDQLAEIDDEREEIKVRSRFYKLSNRRYQSRDFWPTEVSGKKSTEQTVVVGEYEELDGRPVELKRTTSRRGRFFRIDASVSREERERLERWAERADEIIPAGLLADRQDLVSVDVSGSQIQILAVFLGLRDLEKKLRTIPYKELAARRAWARHEDHSDQFKLPKPGPRGQYDGPEDPLLREAAKKAITAYFYGGAPWKIADTLATSPEEFGPGFGSRQNLELFLTDTELGGHEIDFWFKPTCQLVARNACRVDKYAGAVFTDPYDHRQFRWNPVAWNLEPVAGAEEIKVYAKVPLVETFQMAVDSNGRRYPRRVIVERNGKSTWPVATPKNGDYPVWRGKLGQMIAPCLIHMLDAMFAALVVEELNKRGTAVISIHDSWFVARDAWPNLSAAVKAANEPWLRALGVVYDDLIRYLPVRNKRRWTKGGMPTESEYGRWVRRLKERWAARMEKSNDWPEFRVGEVRLVESNWA
jgi:hypothetical protein